MHIFLNNIYNSTNLGYDIIGVLVKVQPFTCLLIRLVVDINTYYRVSHSSQLDS